MENEGMGKNISYKCNKKSAEVALLVSDKIDFEVKNSYKRQRRTLYNSKKSIQREDITIINIFASRIRTSK